MSMTRVVTIHEAKTHLSRLLREAMRGDEIIIAKGAHPLVKLVLLDEARPTRRLGAAKGQIRIADDFDAPLDDFAEYR